MVQPTPFECPSCGAKYKVVRMEAEAPANEKAKVACLTCGAPLEARDGKFILKYFRVRRGSR
jgi:predicted Zn finger-like uncharacterized protein